MPALDDLTQRRSDGLRFRVLKSPEEFSTCAEEWNVLAELSGSPFLTAEWVLAWWRAFGLRDRLGGKAFAILGADSGRRVQAGAFLFRRPGGRLGAAANVYTEEWDVLADGPAARAACWAEIVHQGACRLHLAALPDAATSAALQALMDGRARVVASPEEANPRLRLPASWEGLLASVSANLRSQVGRRERALRAAGSLVFRTVRGGPSLDRELDRFLALEASGWKGRAGTAIAADRRTTRLYRDWAHGMAERGRLRLHLLELDGSLVAADLGCVYAGTSYLIKTGYSESHRNVSPGLVLRAAVLRSSIEERCGFYDFLGGPQPYKMRWGAESQQRWTIDGYRGPWRPVAIYHGRARPLLKAGRDHIRAAGRLWPPAPEERSSAARRGQARRKPVREGSRRPGPAVPADGHNPEGQP